MAGHLKLVPQTREKQVDPERAAKKKRAEQEWAAAIQQMIVQLNALNILPPDATIAQAKQYVAQHVRKGCISPVTGQHVKIYKYKMHRSMVQCLVGLVYAWAQTQDWVHVNDIMVPRYDKSAGRVHLETTKESAKVRGGHLAKGTHWGFLVQKENEDTRKRTSGLWMPSQTAVDFVTGQNTMPSHAFLFNNTCLGWTGEYISVADALGIPFVYSELMSGS